MHISQNAPYLPPKIFISIVLNFSWDSCYTWEKWKSKDYAKFWGANKVYYGRCTSSELPFFYKERSRRRHCCCCRCCCLSSAISTVDNRTLLKESDSKATWGTLEILRNCVLVRTVYMTHSSLAKQSYFEMNCFAINMIGVCWLKDSVFRLRITSIRFTIFWSINRLKICSYICKVFVQVFTF